MSFTVSDLKTDNIEILRQRMAEEGYLFFHNLIDPQQISEVREEVIQTLVKKAWADTASTSTKALPMLPLCLPNTEHFVDKMTSILAIESLHRLAYHPQILKFIEKLIGEEVVPHPLKIPRIIYPQSWHPESTTPAHQDFIYCQGSTNAFTAWVPLGDCPKELGGLKILKGSQKWGLQPIKGEGSNRCGIINDLEKHPNWVTCDYRVGDLLLFNFLTIHGGQPNLMDQLRLSVDFRYQSVNEPICNNELQPPFKQLGIPDWSKFTQHWSTTKWIKVPEAMQIVEFKSLNDIICPKSSKFISLDNPLQKAV